MTNKLSKGTNRLLVPALILIFKEHALYLQDQISVPLCISKAAREP